MDRRDLIDLIMSNLVNYCSAGAKLLFYAVQQNL